MVENLTHNPEIGGSKPASGSGRQKIIKKVILEDLETAATLTLNMKQRLSYLCGGQECKLFTPFVMLASSK